MNLKGCKLNEQRTFTCSRLCAKLWRKSSKLRKLGTKCLSQSLQIVSSNLPLMEDEVTYWSCEFRSILALCFPGLVVFRILPTAIEFIYFSFSLGFNLRLQKAIVSKTSNLIKVESFKVEIKRRRIRKSRWESALLLIKALIKFTRKLKSNVIFGLTRG